MVTFFKSRSGTVLLLRAERFKLKVAFAVVDLYILPTIYPFSIKYVPSSYASFSVELFLGSYRNSFRLNSSASSMRIPMITDWNKLMKQAIKNTKKNVIAMWYPLWFSVMQ